MLGDYETSVNPLNNGLLLVLVWLLSQSKVASLSSLLSRGMLLSTILFRVAYLIRMDPYIN